MKSVGIAAALLCAISSSATAKDVPSPERYYSPKIVGGEKVSQAEFEQYSWVTSLQENKLGSHFCGGALVSPNWVLTAAHCVEDGSKPKVVMGAVALSGRNSKRVIRKTKRVIIHADYDADTVKNDIALIELDAAISTIEPIKLISRNRSNEEPGVEVDLIGWGHDEEDADRVQNVLRHVAIPLVSYKTCTKRGAYGKDEVTRATNLCAGLQEGGKDSCQGDSGGPMFAPRGNGKFELLGIVSWGEGCAKPKKYGIYTRVSAFLPWIQERVPNLYSGNPPPSPPTPKPTTKEEAVLAKERVYCRKQRNLKKCSRGAVAKRCVWDNTICESKLAALPAYTPAPTISPTTSPTWSPTPPPVEEEYSSADYSGSYSGSTYSGSGYSGSDYSGGSYSSYASSEDLCADLTQTLCKNEDDCTWDKHSKTCFPKE